uniref:Uncharacterized protein n=1 Tax=viral metagenome TaxID=1070528 RepID=A0A6C0BUW0_9ZZZZ
MTPLGTLLTVFGILIVAGASYEIYNETSSHHRTKHYRERSRYRRDRTRHRRDYSKDKTTNDFFGLFKKSRRHRDRPRDRSNLTKYRTRYNTKYNKSINNFFGLLKKSQKNKSQNKYLKDKKITAKTYNKFVNLINNTNKRKNTGLQSRRNTSYKNSRNTDDMNSLEKRQYYLNKFKYNVHRTKKRRRRIYI